MEDMDTPEEVTLIESKEEVYKLRKTERDNQRRVAIQAKQRRKQQAMKKQQSQLGVQKKVRGTTEDARLGTDSILSEKQQDIYSPEEGRSEHLSDPAFDKGQGDSNNPNIEGMLPDSIVNFLAAREKQSQLDSIETMVGDPTTRLKPKEKKMKFKHGNNRTGGVQLKILNGMSSLEHVQNAKAFRQDRQLRVQRSPTMLQRANKAFTFLSKQGLLSGR